MFPKKSGNGSGDDKILGKYVTLDDKIRSSGQVGKTREIRRPCIYRPGRRCRLGDIYFMEKRSMELRIHELYQKTGLYNPPSVWGGHLFGTEHKYPQITAYNACTKKMHPKLKVSRISMAPAAGGTKLTAQDNENMGFPREKSFPHILYTVYPLPSPR